MSINGNLLAAGLEIRRLREAAKLSQEQLAERANLHRNYIGLIERGERNATLTALFQIASALNITLGALLGGVAGPADPNDDPDA